MSARARSPRLVPSLARSRAVNPRQCSTPPVRPSRAASAAPPSIPARARRARPTGSRPALDPHSPCACLLSSPLRVPDAYTVYTGTDVHISIWTQESTLKWTDRTFPIRSAKIRILGVGQQGGSGGSIRALGAYPADERAASTQGGAAARRVLLLSEESASGLQLRRKR